MRPDVRDCFFEERRKERLNAKAVVRLRATDFESRARFWIIGEVFWLGFGSAIYGGGNTGYRLPPDLA
jgi:hypothetical protein